VPAVCAVFGAGGVRRIRRGDMHRWRCRLCTPSCLRLRAALWAVASDTRLRAQSFSCQRKSAVHRGERNRFLPQSLRPPHKLQIARNRLRRFLAPSAVRRLPTRPAPLGSCGNPKRASVCLLRGLLVRNASGILRVSCRVRSTLQLEQLLSRK